MSSPVTQNGYIALMSAIIISVVLVMLSVSVSTAGFYSRFNVVEFEYKQRSSALAEGCINSALLKLAQNPAYVPTAGGETIFIGTDSCTILSVTTTAGQITIQSKATFQQAVTNVQVVVTSGTLSLMSWQELPTL